MATIHCNIDDAIREEAIKALELQGVTLNSVIQSMIAHIAATKEVPFQETRRTKLEIKSRQNPIQKELAA